jgi:phosphoglycolate phosphatase
MTFFFDLDGPILDVSPRYVALHHDLLAEVGVRGMPGGLYWRRKRARVSEAQILRELGAPEHATGYERRRLELIESPNYLALDRCWPCVEKVLGELTDRHEMVLVTARANRPALLEELDRLGVTRFFGEVLSIPAGHGVDRQKAGLINDYLRKNGQSPDGNWIVGDTEADIGAGRLVGLFTAGVLCGIRDREWLAAARPDVLLDDIRDLREATSTCALAH